MIPSPDVVLLSRIQFGLTASFHFFFVPLTLGLSWLLLIMESVYVMTGKQIYRDMTRFWGKLFGINFAMGVITGLTLEFQFGQNWAFFSQYIGNVFGVPLAIEGIIAFMLESAFLGIFFFGWDRLSKVQHLLATACLAIGSSMSAMVILVANSWMQHPVGEKFNFSTLRMDFIDFPKLVLNPDAQVNFVHTLAAGYVTGSVFVLAVSAFYLLKNRDSAFARRSFAVASGFGLAAVCAVVYLGDANGLAVAKYQPAKMAALEAEWKTEKPPASFNLFAIPDQETQTNRYQVSIPWALGLIATHSLVTPILGVNDLVKNNEQRIRNGMLAYKYLVQLRSGDTSAQTKQNFEKYEKDLGYGLLLKQYRPDVQNATPAQIKAAADYTIPDVATVFWAFRIMVACGLLMFFIFVGAVYFCTKRKWQKRWFLWVALLSLPLPWLAAEAGWFVTEHGRQPWSVDGVLPTFLGTSSLSTTQVWTSLTGFALLYTTLFVVEMYLMIKYIRLGPSSLRTGRYHYEQQAIEQPA